MKTKVVWHDYVGVCALLVIGCDPVWIVGCAVSQIDSSYEESVQEWTSLEPAPPWSACANFFNPCVTWAYCDEQGRMESPLCQGQPDKSCVRAPAAVDLACFPSSDGTVRIGTCQGETLDKVRCVANP